MSLYRYTDSGPYWYRFKVAGVSYRKSTHTRNRREAEEAERRARAEIEGAAVRGAQGGLVDLAQLMEWDLERSEAGGSTPEWRVSLERQWTHLTDFLDARTSASRLTYERLQEYVSHRRAMGACGNTINRDLQTLRRGIEEAKAHNRFVKPIAKWPDVANDSSGKNKGKFIPLEVIAAWFGELEGSALDQARVVLLTGIRAEEVRRLAWTWVERAPKGSPTPWVLRLPAPATKGRKERDPGLPADGYEILKRRYEVLGDGSLFPENHKKAFKSAATRAGWPKTITLRDLRHTHSTLAQAHGADVRSIQHALGHGSLETTERYLTALRSSAPAATVAELLGCQSGGVRAEVVCSKHGVLTERATGFEPATPSLGSYCLPGGTPSFGCSACLEDARKCWTVRMVPIDGCQSPVSEHSESAQSERRTA